MTELLLLGYSKHKLSTIYRYSLTKSHISHITAHDLTPLSTTATFFCPQGGDWFDLLTLPTEMLIRHRLTNRQCQMFFEIQRINN